MITLVLLLQNNWKFHFRRTHSANGKILSYFYVASGLFVEDEPLIASKQSATDQTWIKKNIQKIVFYNGS